MNVGTALITDLGHLNRDETGVIMAKIRDKMGAAGVGETVSRARWPQGRRSGAWRLPEG